MFSDIKYQFSLWRPSIGIKKYFCWNSRLTRIISKHKENELDREIVVRVAAWQAKLGRENRIEATVSYSPLVLLAPELSTAEHHLSCSHRVNTRLLVWCKLNNIILLATWFSRPSVQLWSAEYWLSRSVRVSTRPSVPSIVLV